jgi:hypothetical protein
MQESMVSIQVKLANPVYHFSFSPISLLGEKDIANPFYMLLFQKGEGIILT